MKKIWLLLLMTSCVGFFAACSDDDDNGGGNNGENPITDLYLSDEIIVGDTTVLLGKGFAADAQIYVENAAGERTKIENVEVNEKGITFVLPDLPGGDYALILKQNNGQWKLGTFKVVPMVEVTRLKSIAMAGILKETGEEVMPVTYSFAYDDYGKMTSYSMGGDNLDEEGNPVTITISATITYKDNTIEVGGEAFDNEMSFPVTYTLENGRIVSSTTKNRITEYMLDENGDILYDEDGPIVLHDTLMDVEYEWTYNGDYLSTVTGSDETTVTYHFTNDNLTKVDGIEMPCEFEYGSELNTSNTEMAVWFVSVLMGYSDNLFAASLMGKCGKFSTNLPTMAAGSTCTYEFKDGRVSCAKLDVDPSLMQKMTFEYETTKIMPEK